MFLLPWNFLDGALLRVRTASTRCANILLNGLGLETQAQGFRLVEVNEGLVVGLSVSAASVGALVLLLFLAALLALAPRRPTWWRVLVWLSSGPAFVAGQALLLTILVLAGSAMGSSAALDGKTNIQMALLVGLSFLLVVCFDAAGRRWLGARSVVEE